MSTPLQATLPRAWVLPVLCRICPGQIERCIRWDAWVAWYLCGGRLCSVCRLLLTECVPHSQLHAMCLKTCGDCKRLLRNYSQHITQSHYLYKPTAAPHDTTQHNSAADFGSLPELKVLTSVPAADTTPTQQQTLETPRAHISTACPAAQRQSQSRRKVSQPNASPLLERNVPQCRPGAYPACVAEPSSNTDLAHNSCMTHQPLPLHDDNTARFHLAAKQLQPLY